MAKTLKEMMANLEPKRRVKVKAMAEELIAKEMTLRELRKQFDLTQNQLATAMKLTQDNVSRIEKRVDLKISTVRHCIEAMGGELHMIAKFPKKPLIELTGFAEQDEA